MQIESRVVSARVELRAKEEGDRRVRTLHGLAAVYGQRSQDLGGFVEEIEPGAFDASLEAGDNVMARGEHDSRMLLGTTEGGTLRLRSTKEGLEYEVDLPDTSAGRDIGVLVERGDVTKSSFAFKTIRDRWEDLEDGMILRTLLEAKLIDVAPVAMPAYQQTSVSARALDQVKAMKAPKPDPEPDARLRSETYREVR